MADTCGAKTRAGGLCKAPAMPNGRCRVHGGPSPGAPKGNQHAFKHGLYSQHFTAEERMAARTLTLGSVDEEIVLTRIRLNRLLAAEAAAAGKVELDEVTERVGGGPTGDYVEQKKRVRDYIGQVDKLTARIESLEKTRSALLEKGGPGADDAPDGFEVVEYDNVE